ncbi:MAG: helix-turn-helix transcriptional regulator [Campylobacterales bacterium]|nr:helix-turn-helix transcriptional regulator [Campylobacterales bacterium]
MKSKLDKITENVKNMRVERGYSTLHVANALGHDSLSYVNRIEQRKNGANYNLTHLLILSHEFGVDICEFFKEK